MTTYDVRPFDERFADAQQFLRLRFVERGEFLSDSDVLDAADQFVDVPRPADDAPLDDPMTEMYYEAHGAFAEALFAWIQPGEDDS